MSNELQQIRRLNRGTARYLTLCLTTLALFLFAGANEAFAKFRTYIESQDKAELYIARVDETVDPGSRSESGRLKEQFIVESPKELKGHRIEILFERQGESELSKLALEAKRIGFRMKAGRLQSSTRFLHESDITDVFNSGKFPSIFRYAGDLDRHPETPSKRRPRLSKDLNENHAQGVSKFLVLLGREAEVIQTVPLQNSNRTLEEATLEYIHSTEFRIGKLDGEPSPYYMLVSVVYSVD